MTLPRLPARIANSHKLDYGRAVLVGGSRGMSGAISLSGMAALRSGAGLVTLAVPDTCLETVASFDPCYMTVPLASDESGRMASSAEKPLLEVVGTATCGACGPGMSRSRAISRIVSTLYRGMMGPMVVDADALNALAGRPRGLGQRGGPRILTPHPGEFRRLAGDKDLTIDQCRDMAPHLAAEHGVVIVLKGHETLVTDGAQTVVNQTGNPGMATGGSGDVLTGVITALVCQGLAPFDAARLGTHIHGLAGDLARDDVGEISLTAKDIIDYLPEAFEHSHRFENRA